MTTNKTGHAALGEGVLATVVGYHIARARVTTQSLFATYIGEPYKLKPVEFSLLALLSANGSLTPKQLSLMLALSSSLLTLLLDRMQARKLIVRVRSTVDGRSQQVSLTTTGKELARELEGRASEMEAELQRILSPAEHGMLIELLSKVAGR